MTKEQKRSLIVASIIGTLLSTYNEKERTNMHRELQSRLGKGIRDKVRLYGTDTILKVAHKEGNAIWKQAVDHFAERKITIEAASCILSLWSLDEKVLSKHYGLGKGVIGKFCKPSRREDRVELEMASREVAKYVFNAVNELYGIEVEKKMSVMERLNMMKESA